MNTNTEKERRHESQRCKKNVKRDGGSPGEGKVRIEGSGGWGGLRKQDVCERNRWEKRGVRRNEWGGKEKVRKMNNQARWSRCEKK